VTGALIGFCFVLGLVIGSFLNVVIYRVPRKESIVRPPSHCPNCGTELAVRDNVPVVSWLLLRGRCRTCANPISARYPLVELGCGILFALLAWRFADQPWLLPAYLWFAAAGLALAYIDIETMRLPNVLTLPSIAVVAALLVLPAAAYHQWSAYLRGWEGAAALFVFYSALVLARGMGRGDRKLAPVLGLCLGYLGWGALLVGSFLGFVLGGVVGIVLIAGKRAGRKTKIPFGPYMILGAYLGLFIGQPVTNWYVQHFAS
jgi:leader peptidase (prepilin peptidase) / N-methyltransferase